MRAAHSVSSAQRAKAQPQSHLEDCVLFCPAPRARLVADLQTQVQLQSWLFSASDHPRGSRHSPVGQLGHSATSSLGPSSDTPEIQGSPRLGSASFSPLGNMGRRPPPSPLTACQRVTSDSNERERPSSHQPALGTSRIPHPPKPPISVGRPSSPHLGALPTLPQTAPRSHCEDLHSCPHLPWA